MGLCSFTFSAVKLRKVVKTRHLRIKIEPNLVNVLFCAFAVLGHRVACSPYGSSLALPTCAVFKSRRLQVQNVIVVSPARSPFHQTSLWRPARPPFFPHGTAAARDRPHALFAAAARHRAAWNGRAARQNQGFSASISPHFKGNRLQVCPSPPLFSPILSLSENVQPTPSPSDSPPTSHRARLTLTTPTSTRTCCAGRRCASTAQVFPAFRSSFSTARQSGRGLGPSR
jgi:hypothetical protein